MLFLSLPAKKKLTFSKNHFDNGRSNIEFHTQFCRKNTCFPGNHLFAWVILTKRLCKEGVSKGHPSFLRCCSFDFVELVPLKRYSVLLLLQNKWTKEKESGKVNHTLFVRPLHKAIKAPPNRVRFPPFPVCLRTFKRFMLLINSEKEGDASPSQKPQVMWLEVRKNVDQR